MIWLLLGSCKTCGRKRECRLFNGHQELKRYSILSAFLFQMVQRLHKFGIKVGIITNGHFLVQRNKLKACKADLLFDTILVGGEEPNQKPHKSIFLKACSLAGCNPEETIMVGDNLKTDIQGAQNAGFLATVWVNLHNLEDLPAGGATPDHVISNILELPELLKTLEVDLGQ